MLISILIAILVIALTLWLIQLLPLDAMILRILQVAVVIVAIIWLVSRFGSI